MQETFIGFNTAGITHEDRFLALMLKTKQDDQRCQIYYLQAQVLADILLILQYRMAVILQRLTQEGEAYRTALVKFNEKLIENTPPVDMTEIQQPDPARRVMSITLKPAETWSTLILILQNEQVVSLRIDDMQVEALLIGIQQSLKNSVDEQTLEYFSSALDFIMLYTLDLTNLEQMSYQQYLQDEWKLNLFSHYLAVLYCSDTQEGKKIISGAIIKTNAAHFSEKELDIMTRLAEKSPKLKEVHDKYQITQPFSQLIPSQPGKILTLEECLRPLHAFYLEKQASLNAQP
jgi:hypothetical protein